MSLLNALQDAARDKLLADDFFTPVLPSADEPIPVFSENLKDIGSQIEIEIGKIGLCVVILTAQGRNTAPNAKLYWEEITVVARVFEQPTLNTALPRAAQVAEACAYVLHLFRPTIETKVMNPYVAENITLVDDREFVIYDANFKTNGGIASKPVRA
jgi:hypothetical protein